MYYWYYCQQVWAILSELHKLLGKMEAHHLHMVEKMLSEKMVRMMASRDAMRRAAIAHFQMATYLAESFGYIKALMEAGICPTPEQVRELVKNHLEPMEMYHHKMKEEMEKMKAEMENMKKKHKEKHENAMSAMEEMMAEMKETHHRVAELIEELKKF